MGSNYYFVSQETARELLAKIKSYEEHRTLLHENIVKLIDTFSDDHLPEEKYLFYRMKRMLKEELEGIGYGFSLFDLSRKPNSGILHIGRLTCPASGTLFIWNILPEDLDRYGINNLIVHESWSPLDTDTCTVEEFRERVLSVSPNMIMNMQEKEDIFPNEIEKIRKQ